MAHGKSLDMRAITRPEPQWIKQFLTEEQTAKRGRRKLKRLVKVGDWTPHVNPARDRKQHARLKTPAIPAAVEALPEASPGEAATSEASGTRRLSGSARRRQKALNRRRWVSDLRVEKGLTPLDAISVMKCSCGVTMWLREGADATERESFDRDAADHDWCDGIPA